MKNFFLKWIVNTAALWVVVWIVPGIWASRLESLVVASLVLGLLNTFIRPFLLIVTLPLQIFSLGFFTLVINGFLFYAAGRMVEGFTINGFWSAFRGALFFSIISFIINLVLQPGGNVQFHYQRYSGQPDKSRDKDIIDVEGEVSDGDNKPRIGP